jgi:ribosomal protein S18 acetylase RimI-like enzyme
MEFLQSTLSDLETIFQHYDAAIALQKAVSDQHWLPFEPTLVATEVQEGRQWKIMLDGKIACVFLVAYADPAIWGDRDADPAIYLHRIVTNPAFRGQNFVQKIVDWAKVHAAQHDKKFIRLDTWSDNPKLKTLYLKCGFEFLGDVTPANPKALPSHYSAITLGLYEIALI